MTIGQRVGELRKKGDDARWVVFWTLLKMGTADGICGAVVRGRSSEW